MKVSRLISGIILTTSLKAIIITGQGYGNNEKDSLEESLADLSSRISVNVKSDFKSYITTNDTSYDKRKEKLIELSSSLPIKSAKFVVLDGNDLTKTTASITTKYSLKAYMSELERLAKNIADGVLESTKKKNNALQHTILTQVLQDLENFNKHKIVATMLGAKNIPLLKETEAKIKTQLLQLEKSVESIDLAASVLSKGMIQNKIYISAMRLSGSTEVTQLAKILKDTMSTKLNTTSKSLNADYVLRGDYEILTDSIFITLRLSDKDNNIVKVATINISPSAYKNIKYEATSKSFDRSLMDEYITSSTLNVNIGFKGYNSLDGIDLRKDDIVDIVVKASKPVCYFLIGHTLKKEEKFSYLLPIGSGTTPFTNSITGEDVNRALAVSEEVPVSAPFGSENLQLFASTFGANGKCPLVVPNCKENEDEYCVIDGEPSHVIYKTRGLNLKKKKMRVEKAESSISFTSFEK